MSRLAAAVLPLALAAAALALLVPSPALAERSELLLAALVLLTALGIAPRDLIALGVRWRAVLALSVVPFAFLFPAAWLLSRAFAGPIREGVLALGLAPTEVAAAGLVGLAAGDAALALAAVAGSLAVSALAGPLVLTALGASGAPGGELLAGFAAVVLAPLVVGVVLRAVLPRLERSAESLAGVAALVLATLVYAALSAAGAGDLVEALVAGAAFLLVSVALALLWPARGTERVTPTLILALRDFAVAAALAEQAFGAAAATVTGVYGVLMLVAGAAVSAAARRRPSSENLRL